MEAIREKEVEEMTREQVIYNLSIYLQTNGEVIPPAFKSSLKFCLRLLVREATNAKTEQE